MNGRLSKLSSQIWSRRFASWPPDPLLAIASAGSQLTARFGKGGFNQGYGFGGRPLGGPEHAADFVTASVDQHRCGKSDCLQLVEGRGGWIEKKSKIGCTRLLEIALRCCRSLPVKADGDNLEILRTHLPLQCGERRHLLATGRAPGSPQIDEHDATAPIIQGLGLARRSGEFEIGGRQAFRSYDECGERAGCQLLGHFSG